MARQIYKKNYKHHPESFHTSHHPSSRITQQVELLDLSSINGDNKNGLSDKNNYKYHPEPSYISYSSNGLTQQVELSRIHHIEDDDYDNGSTKKKIKNNLHHHLIN